MRTLNCLGLILCLVLLVDIVHGQVYVKLGAGYGFPLAGEYIGNSGRQQLTTTLDPESGTQVPRILIENESIHGSYGAGLLLDGSVGYMFTDQLGVEAMISYVLGRKYEVVSTGLDSRVGTVLYDSRLTAATQCKGFFFAPMVKLTTANGLIHPYLMVGPVFGKVYFHSSQDIITFDTGITITEGLSARYRGGLAKGARGIAGVEMELKSSLSIFAEAIVTGINYYPKEGELTRYEVNGENALGLLTTRDRQTRYVKRVTFDTDQPRPSDDNPDQQTRFSLPLSSVAANVGVRFSFGN